MLGALHVEVRERGLGRAVEVVVGQALAVQRQVLHQVGDPGPGERLVGDTDAEDQSGTHGPGGVREEGGYAVDLGVMDALAHRLPLPVLFGIHSASSEGGGTVFDVRVRGLAEVTPRVVGGQVAQGAEVRGGACGVADQREERGEDALDGDPPVRGSVVRVQDGPFGGLDEFGVDVRRRR